MKTLLYRMSCLSGSVLGGDEVFIFTERVIKGNIKVRFFQVSFIGITLKIEVLRKAILDVLQANSYDD